VENIDFSLDTAFPGGSVSIKQYPDLINGLKESSRPEVRALMVHAAAWGRWIEKTLPAVCARVGGPEIIQKQFTPADALLAMLACNDLDEMGIVLEPTKYILDDKYNSSFRNEVISEPDPSSCIMRVSNILPGPLIAMLRTLL